MNVNELATCPAATVRRRVRRLRTAGYLALLLGLGGAGFAYWRGTSADDLPVDGSLIGYTKVETRQVELMYGQQGLLMEHVREELKQPGTQMFLIAAAAAAVAGGCFYVARLLASNEED